jgi:hypothetical protein
VTGSNAQATPICSARGRRTGKQSGWAAASDRLDRNWSEFTKSGGEIWKQEEFLTCGAGARLLSGLR